ncbi:hypothetical protein KGF56_000694 [Candida oxycetoniae]|uniref:Uncharacterized protein n=1 Tax=Candida oxycetoniae TaxID=497107 RepID=A0AAI9WZN7_9ASCO|nr:uncharacterized protein KGF56_000694 [Candida oxycetoniae]KAI3406562.2 hypothetical protein KGF56_000694 [Candida oxycetoniae]
MDDNQSAANEIHSTMNDIRFSRWLITLILIPIFAIILALLIWRRVKRRRQGKVVPVYNTAPQGGGGAYAMYGPPPIPNGQYYGNNNMDYAKHQENFSYVPPPYPQQNTQGHTQGHYQGQDGAEASSGYIPQQQGVSDSTTNYSAPDGPPPAHSK